ncbi:hypothetical protein ABZ490_48715 [Streptomyces sp. NPDC005811]|uniref:hypothetical protein n=1 Tax=Streptomyces sp. NPDC005811 TaxID=3154565 RepID=UPI003411D67F
MVIGFAVPAFICASIFVQLAGMFVKSFAGNFRTSGTGDSDKLWNDFLQSFQGGDLEHRFQDISQGSISLVTGGGGGTLPKAVSDSIDLGYGELLALILMIFVTGYVVTRPFVSAFRLKRQILCLADQSELSLHRTASSWFVNRSIGAYEQEEKAFKTFDRKPIPEKPVDLVILAFPPVCLFVLAMLYAWFVARDIDEYQRYGARWQEWVPVALYFVFIELWIGCLGILRISWLLSALQGRRGEVADGRVESAKQKTPFVGKVRTTGLYVEARPLTEAAAWPMTTGLLMFSWLVYPLLGAIQFHRIALTENRLSGRGGNPAVATLAFVSVVATPLAVSRLLWRMSARDIRERRNRFLAIVSLPALYVLPAVQIASLYLSADEDLDVSSSSWLILCSLGCGLLSAFLYTMISVSMQQCQNRMIPKIADEVKYGECEDVRAPR